MVCQPPHTPHARTAHATRTSVMLSVGVASSDVVQAPVDQLREEVLDLDRVGGAAHEVVAREEAVEERHVEVVEQLLAQLDHNGLVDALGDEELEQRLDDALELPDALGRLVVVVRCRERSLTVCAHNSINNGTTHNTVHATEAYGSSLAFMKPRPRNVSLVERANMRMPASAVASWCTAACLEGSTPPSPPPVPVDLGDGAAAAGSCGCAADDWANDDPDGGGSCCLGCMSAAMTGSIEAHARATMAR